MAGGIYDSAELWARAVNSVSKSRDLEGFDDFRVLSRELDEYDNFVILPRVLTRAQRRARAGNRANQNLGIARGGAQAAIGPRGGDRGGRNGNVGRGGRAGRGGRGEAQPLQGAQAAPNNGVNPDGQAPQPVYEALPVIVNPNSVRSRTAAVPRILRGMQIAHGHRGGHLIGGRQWVHANYNPGVHDPGLANGFRQRVSVAQGVAQVTSGQGNFHSTHGNHVIRPEQWAANTKITPIPPTAPSSAASVNAWDASVVRTGVDLRPNQLGLATGHVMASANSVVRTRIQTAPGSRVQHTIFDGDTTTSTSSFSEAPIHQTVITGHVPGPPRTITHLVEIDGPGRVESIASMAVPAQAPGVAIPLRPQGHLHHPQAQQLHPHGLAGAAAQDGQGLAPATPGHSLR